MGTIIESWNIPNWKGPTRIIEVQLLALLTQPQQSHHMPESVVYQERLIILRLLLAKGGIVMLLFQSGEWDCWVGETHKDLVNNFGLAWKC